MEENKLIDFVATQEKQAIERSKKATTKKSEFLNIGMEMAFGIVLEYLSQSNKPESWKSVLKDIEIKSTKIKGNKIIQTYGKKEL